MSQTSPALKLSPFNPSIRRTAATPPEKSPEAKLRRPEREKKFKTMEEIMAKAKHCVIERDDYSDVNCELCGSGTRPEEILLCDRCDVGFHMGCVRPVVVRVPLGSWLCAACSDPPCVPYCKKGRRRVVCYKKKRRRLLPYVPTEDRARRLEQMRSLATALTALKMEFSNELTYLPAMSPRSANQAKLEYGGMQVLCREDLETLEQCKMMAKRGECPPLVVVYDSCEGFTVEADGPIKDMTLIGEYTGDVDYIKNRERDDCDSLMTLLLAEDPFKSLIICPDKRGNIARFISGINNHTPESKKKQNLKCVRYDVDGECRVLIVATRDIAKGERLYYDYNGYEHEYPTQHFI